MAGAIIKGICKHIHGDISGRIHEKISEKTFGGVPEGSLGEFKVESMEVLLKGSLRNFLKNLLGNFERIQERILEEILLGITLEKIKEGLRDILE